MTATVAILALLLGSRPPLALVLKEERLQLPGRAGTVRLESRPLVREVVLHVGAGAGATARKLDGTSRLCPEAEAVGGAVVLRCPTPRLRATLVATGAGLAVDLAALTVPAWRADEEGPPLVPFDTEALGLGPCPGTTPEVRGECALKDGRLDEARARFEEAVRAGTAPLAELRLGDLALRDDAPAEALARWRRAREFAPWGRLAAVRACELDPRCLASSELEAIYDTAVVEPPLRGDVTLRRARLRALAGERVAAARTLAAETRPGGACLAAAEWCRHVLLTALGRGGEEGGEALDVYLSTPGLSEGPLSLELVRAAAQQAERAGAAAFAANLLASATGRIPGPALADHLHRVARLYLAAGDRPRAEEILRFARTRLAAAELASPRWRAVRRELRPAPAPVRAPVAAPPDDPDVRAAHAALEAARLVASPTGARR